MREENIYMRAMATARQCNECGEPIPAGSEALVGEVRNAEKRHVQTNYYHEACGAEQFPFPTLTARSLFNENRDHVAAE